MMTHGFAISSLKQHLIHHFFQSVTSISLKILVHCKFDFCLGVIFDFEYTSVYFDHDILNLNQCIYWLNICLHMSYSMLWEFVLLVHHVDTEVFYIKCLVDGCQGYLSRVLSLFLLFSLDLLLCGPSSTASSCKTHILHVQLSSQHYIHTGTCQRIRVYTL